MVRHLVMPGLEVAACEARPRETVTAFLRRSGWALRDRRYGWQFRKGLPTILEINGEAVLRKQWARRKLAANDVVRFVSYPLGPLTGGGGNTGKEIAGLVALVAITAFAIWAGPAAAGLLGLGKLAAGLITAGVALGGSLLVNALVAPKQGATNAPSSTQDQIYSVTAQNNVSKLGQPLPVWYGRLKDAPDLAATPWSEFVGNDQYLNVLLSVSMGLMSYEALYLDQTVLWDPTNGISATFPGAQVAFYNPGDAVTLFPVNVDQSVDVSGQQFPDGVGDSNFPPATPGAVLGPFVTNPSGTQATSIVVDFVFPGGCFTQHNGDPAFYPQNFRLIAQYAPVNNAGATTGPFVTLFDVTRTYCSNAPIRDSIQTTVAAGRYTVQVQRGDQANVFGTSTCLWAGLRSFLVGNNTFPDVSTVAIRLLASQSTQGAFMFGVLGTRQLPVWNGSAFVTGATRNPAWAFMDAVTNSQYGSTLDVSKVDFNAVVNHATGCTSRGDTFDYRFETAVAVPEALDKILQTSRATHYWLGDTVSIVRDEWRDVPTMMLTDREIVRDSTQVSFQMLGDEDPDAVVIEYVDEDTWLPAEVQYPPNGVGFTAVNPEVKRLDGVVQRAQAFRECAFMYLQSIYRRETVQIGCEYEGRAITRGSVLRVQSELPEAYGYAGAIIASSGDTLTMDPAPTWDTGPFYMRLRQPNGTYFGPVLCTQGSDTAHAVLDAASLSTAQIAQSTTLSAVLAREDGAEYPTFEFGTATTESKLCMVLGGQPNGELFTLQLVVDDIRVHTTDLGDPPVLPTSQFPANGSVPLIVGLNAQFAQGIAEPMLSASWFPAAGAEYYVADVSYDSGATWAQVYEGEANSFAEVVTLAALTLRVRAVTPGKLRGPYATTTLDAPTIEVADATVALQSLINGVKYQVTTAIETVKALSARIDGLATSLSLGDLSRNWLDKQTLRRELSSISGTAQAQITELFTVATTTTAALAETNLNLTSGLDAANASIDATNTALTTLTQSVADQTTSFNSQFASVTGSITTEIQTRSSADGALSARIDSLKAQTDNSFAMVSTEITANATETDALAAQQTTLTTTVNGHTASLTSLQSSVAGGAVYAGLIGTIDGVTGGLILEGIRLNGTTSFNLLIEGNVIVNGSITGLQIQAGAINTVHLAVNSVDITKLIAGAATAIYSTQFGGGGIAGFPGSAGISANIQGGHALVLLTCIAGTGAGLSANFTVLVDGNAQAAWPVYFPASGSWSNSFCWVVTGLGPGNHTFLPSVTGAQVSGGVMTVIDLRR